MVCNSVSFTSIAPVSLWVCRNIFFFILTNIGYFAQILADEPLSQAVCRDCESQLLKFHEFREICIKSDLSYRGEPTGIKQELDLNIGEKTSRQDGNGWSIIFLS
jgi:hypothetical protein